MASLDTNAAGNAFITIRPEGTKFITIGTWHNAVQDGGTNSLIPFASDLYTRLAEMRVGDRVIFRGRFAASDEDHLAAQRN
ncbi:MAG: hypothetical protein M3R24_11635 [Chloroflexota bacterium]|nr:hypothetical protein [Chloroflexota bacterium]PLS82566.1 MAG: hypothetical protein CYG59_03795 [Chloroflexota bacterium]